MTVSTKSVHFLPEGTRGEMVPALAHDTSATPGLAAISSSAARATLPDHRGFVQLSSTANCRVEWGDSSVDADSSSHIFPIGSEIVKVPKDVTHISVIEADSGDSGSFSVQAVI